MDGAVEVHGAAVWVLLLGNWMLLVHLWYLIRC